MKSRFFFVLLAALLFVGAHSWAQTYNPATDLGWNGSTPGGGAPLSRINNNGQVAGSGNYYTYGATHGYLYSPPVPPALTPTLTDIGSLGAYPTTSFGIDKYGNVVGQGTTAAGSSHAFFYPTGGTMIDLTPTLQASSSSIAFSINNFGEIVGYSTNASGASSAFLYTVGKPPIQPLGPAVLESNSQAWSINDNGQIVGNFIAANGYTHAFLYCGSSPQPLPPNWQTWMNCSKDSVTDLGALISDGNLNSYAFRINNAGLIMIASDSGPFLYNSSGQMINAILPSPGFSGSPTYLNPIGMNNYGQVVGDWTVCCPYDGFLYSGGNTTDLNSLGLSEFALVAFDINDSGQIPIWAGEEFLLTPTPPDKPITIKSVGGWTLDSLVEDAQWQGQPSEGKRPEAGTNIYYQFYAIDVCQQPNSPCYVEGSTKPVALDPSWTLTGLGFCPSSPCAGQDGQIVFSDPNISPVTVPASQWTPTSVTFTPSFAPNVPFQYTNNPGVAVTITTPDGLVSGPLMLPQPPNPSKQWPPAGQPLWHGGVVATIDGRGYGQCTWFVANQLLAQRLTIPYPAYHPTDSIPENGGACNQTCYEPQQWDVIDFGVEHTAIIILPVPPPTTAPQPGGGTLNTYTFTIGEMNVGTCTPKGVCTPWWSEQPSTITSTFEVLIPPTGPQIVQKGIESLYRPKPGQSPWATAYFRPSPAQ